MKQANDRIDKIAKHEAFTRSDRQPNLKNVQDQDLQAGPFRLFTLGLHLLDQSENVTASIPKESYARITHQVQVLSGVIMRRKNALNIWCFTRGLDHSKPSLHVAH